MNLKKLFRDFGISGFRDFGSLACPYWKGWPASLRRVNYIPNAVDSFPKNVDLILVVPNVFCTTFWEAVHSAVFTRAQIWADVDNQGDSTCTQNWADADSQGESASGKYFPHVLKAEQRYVCLCVWKNVCGLKIEPTSRHPKHGASMGESARAQFCALAKYAQPESHSEACW